MNRLAFAVTALSIVVPGSAQHVNVINPSRPMAAPAGAYRYGNILFPGGVPSNPSQTHAGRLGSTISGYPPYTGVGPGVGRPNRTVVVPYAYPVFYGGGYGVDPGYGQQPPVNNVTVVVPQPPTPTVVINQNFGPEQAHVRTSANEGGESSGIRVWESSPSKPQVEKSATQPSPPERSMVADEKPNIFLIALKDSTLRSAIGYWVEDSTLQYVTPQGSVNHVSLDMVDRDLSERLNRERKLDFELKSAQPARR